MRRLTEVFVLRESASPDDVANRVADRILSNQRHAAKYGSKRDVIVKAVTDAMANPSSDSEFLGSGPNRTKYDISRAVTSALGVTSPDEAEDIGITAGGTAFAALTGRPY